MSGVVVRPRAAQPPTSRHAEVSHFRRISRLLGAAGRCMPGGRQRADGYPVPQEFYLADESALLRTCLRAFRVEHRSDGDMPRAAPEPWRVAPERCGARAARKQRSSPSCAQAAPAQAAPEVRPRFARAAPERRRTHPGGAERRSSGARGGVAQARAAAPKELPSGSEAAPDGSGWKKRSHCRGSFLREWGAHRDSPDRP